MDDMNKTYSVKLSNGTKINGLKKNGDNFVSTIKIDPDIFDGNLAPVVISDGDTEETHTAMELVQVTEMGKEWWFVLIDIPDKELSDMRMASDIAYVAMMTGVDL